jgi:hypothetical protein
MRNTGFIGPLQALARTAAHIGRRPVLLVHHHGLYRGQQARLHRSHALQRERLVQMQMRIHHGRQHQRSLQIPDLGAEAARQAWSFGG